MTVSIEQWLQQAKQQLESAAHDNHGRESALLDAQLLLMDVLGQNRTYLYTWGDKALTDEQRSQVNTLLEKRLNGEPLAYILGEREFWSLPFKVAPSTLIPRADTETLVEWALDLAANQQLPDTAKAVDLGTGTGAIALAIASEFPNWNITGVDFQAEAVELAQHNQQALKMKNAVIRQSDWFSALADEYFDLIVSNPPYIDEADPHLEQGDVRFEPSSALVAADKGLADLQHIIEQAPDYLNEGGWLLLEHGFQQADAVCELLKQRGFVQIENRKDLGGNPRISGGCWVAEPLP
ncbi:peptide chain release factor N(5)-glutamine methyltransferase [Bacterioplanoides sp. SCSIO 12839]|uniref:peptide chain release factor N(5)-glutamine methyltransferase n=1 Tax=Bacterioplanoides sp. SCSIO 12839 TaxID=2829569 RepID=UPI002104AE10|nr:peptide chain release factor N(5)-glutamine methyltransferase [Bacterioplanoides sp. SCSIO 12839]UTW49229.1 peptide chain release factor N(5)-glutamine methyltransferase [Bacterioplanoides sp. SCSIO 12839]